MPRFITANGETLTIEEWASRIGVKPRTIEARLRDGMDPEEAVTRYKASRASDALIDPVTPFEEDDRCWYVTHVHPDGLTLEEVGQLIGVTRERVRQIEAEAFGKLRRNPQARRVLWALMQAAMARDA